MNIETAQMLISTLTLFVAYCIAVTFAGSFRAWVAYKFGDDTAESFGLLTLNPLAHIDFFGVMLLIFLGFGWGRHVPINPFKIYGPFRTIKIIFAYLSDSLAYLFMALVSLVFLFYSFGFLGLELAVKMISQGRLMQAAFAQVFPQASSILISLGLIAIGLILLTVLLTVLSFVMSCFHLFSNFVLHKFPIYRRYEAILMIAFPILVIVFFFHPLRVFVIKFLIFFANLLIKAFGA